MIYSCVPPDDEQRAIVALVKSFDTRIAQAIARRLRLIDLLDEQRRVLVTKAVTCGLDDAPRRNSGFSFIGLINASWEVSRFKTLVERIDQGVSPQAENFLAAEGSWGVLKAGCSNRGFFNELEHKRLPDGFPIDERLAVAVDDVIVSRASGSPALVGSTARVESLSYRLILSDKNFRPVFKPAIDPAFMVVAMNGFYYREQVEQAISGAEGLANNLPLAALRNFRFVVPPLEEQRRIVSRVNALTQDLVHAGRVLLREVALLREFRSRFVTDLVFGRLDARSVSGAARRKEGGTGVEVLVAAELVEAPDDDASEEAVA